MSKIASTGSRYFIRIPKTGSSSLCDALGLDPLHQHLPPPKGFKGKTFCFVRNPYERAIAIFSHIESYAHANGARWKDFDFFLDTLAANEYRMMDLGVAENQFAASMAYFTDCRVPDYVGRFEALSEDYRGLGEWLGTDLPPLPHLNIRQYDRKVTKDQKRLIEYAWPLDFELFGY